MNKQENINISNLPEDYQFDPNALASKLIQNFNDSFQKRDIFGLRKSINQIEHYSIPLRILFNFESDESKNDFRLKERYSTFLSCLYDFITTLPFIDFTLQADAAKLFSALTVKAHSLPKLEDLHLPLEKALKLHKELFLQPRRLMKKPFPQNELVKYILFLSNVHYFLNESDCDILIEKYLDKIGCFESISLKSTLNFFRFYPTTGKSLQKIVKYLIPLLENPTSHEVTCSIFHYLDKTYSVSNHENYFDWKPYLHTVFNSISNSINPSVQILGDEYSMFENEGFSFPIGITGGFDRESIPIYAASFISSLLVENKEEKGEETTSMAILSILTDFVNAFIPMITPRSNRAEGAVLFIASLIKKIVFTNKRIKSIEGKNKISEEVIEEFVKIIMPFVQKSLFNSPPSIQEKMIKAIPKLALLSYESTVNNLVPFCIQNMVDSEMSSTSKACFKIILNLIPCMLNEKHINENLTKIPKIIDAALERCRNSLLDNYYLGVSVLSEIGQFISIPSEKDINSKLTIQQRMVATSMINSLKVVIDCHFSHNKAITSDNANNQLNDDIKTLKKSQNQKSSMEQRFDFYLSAFDDSHIESIVFPTILKYLKNASNSTLLNAFTFSFIKYLRNVKPDLVTKVLLPKLEELFISSNSTKKPFWAHCLSTAFVACQSFSEVIPHYVELITNLLKIKDEEDKEDKSLDCAYILINKLIGKTSIPRIIDWSYPLVEDEKGKIKWGIAFKENEIKPSWYSIDQKIINSAAEAIFKGIQPHLDKFVSYQKKEQETILKILGLFFKLFELRGKIGQLEIKEINDTLFNIEKSIYQFINEMIPKLQSYNIKEEVLFLITLAISHNKLTYNQYKEKCIISSKKKRKNKSYSYCLLNYSSELKASFYQYIYEINSNTEIILDAVYSSLESEFVSISHQSFAILNTLSYQSSKIHDEFIWKQLDVLEDPNHNEYQLKGALLFFMKSNLSFIMKNTLLLSRLFRGLVSLTYEKSWKINEYLNSLFDGIEFYRSIANIKECKEWRELNNEIISIKRTIDPRYFYTIIRFIVFQDPVPSIEIIKFLIKSLRSSSDVNRLFSLHSLSNLFCRMKPIAPRSKFSTVEEFKCNDMIPYLDKMTTGYNCKPVNYTFYTGPSVFNSEDETTKKYEEIRNLLTNELFVNEGIFTDIFESFVLLHPKEDSPTFNTMMFDFWKGLGQIVKTSIVKNTKSLILRLLDAKYISLTSPVLLTAICELIAGISRSTKHWKPEEKKYANEELLIPACTPLVHLKGCDLTNVSVQAMASTIVSDWDYRRVQWLYDIVKKELSEIKFNKDQMNEVALRSVMNFGNIIFMEANEFFNEEFIEIMTKIVIPLFSDIKKFKLDDISFFAKFLVCRLSLLKQFNPENQNDKPSYYGEQTYKTSYQIASLPFVEVFDKHKESSPELVALFLSEIFSSRMHDYSFFIPFIVERFTDICNIDAKLVDITSGKFLHYGKNIICKCGLLQWENYKSKTCEVLFDNVIKSQILKIRDSLPWNSRLNIVGFLHALTFSHLFLFTKNEFSILIDEIIPPFIADNNQEVRNAARSLLKTLVCILYSRSPHLCAEKVLKMFELANNDKSKFNKNLFVAVSFAAAFLANVTIWFTDCPEWLPDVFNYLESTNAQGKCKEEIKAAVTDFFNRHEGREIPELEEYKYAFSDQYFT